MHAVIFIRYNYISEWGKSREWFIPLISNYYVSYFVRKSKRTSGPSLTARSRLFSFNRMQYRAITVPLVVTL